MIIKQHQQAWRKIFQIVKGAQTSEFPCTPYQCGLSVTNSCVKKWLASEIASARCIYQPIYLPRCAAILVCWLTQIFLCLLHNASSLNFVIRVVVIVSQAN